MFIETYLELYEDQLMITDVKYKCLKCLKDILFVEMVQLKNCPICNQRYCNNCTDEDGTCEDCLNDSSLDRIISLQ